MLHYFIAAIAGFLALVLGLGYLAKADPKKLAKGFQYIGGSALLGLALFLVARGLMIYAIPVGVLGYALLQGRTPFPGTGRRSAGQQSRVRTDYIEMRLDHDTGAMEGMVLQGKFANRMLVDLSLDELLLLMGECSKVDAQAAQLLEAWLDREHPDWRETAGEEYAESTGSGVGGGPMSYEEAYEILGLETGASDIAIRRAHRHLMKKLHPDQGGSTYLAAKINQAKDLLLGD